MDKEEIIDLNVSFTSSDYSDDHDLRSIRDIISNEEKLLNVSNEEELLDALQISFDESLEFNELDIEVSEPEEVGACSRNEYVVKHLEQFMQHNLKFNSSYKSMENMAKVLNSTPNTSVKVPSTTYLLKKCIPAKIKYEFHIKCSSCQNYIISDKNATMCTLCVLPTSQCDYFVTMSLKEQLKLTIDKYFDEILAYSESVIKSNGIADLHNAEVFSKAQKKYPLSNILPLIIIY